MDFSLVPVSRIFKTYQGQARIANLNKKSLVKRAQGQKDQVTISSEARRALQKNSKVDALASVLQELKRLKVPENPAPSSEW
jgi:ribosomal protein L28